MRRDAVLTFAIVCAGWLSAAGGVGAQAQSKPKPVAPPVKASVPAPDAQAPAQPRQATQPPAKPAAPPEAAPSEATLGVPFYPSMQYIESHDAGSGQRFYIFGTTGSFADIVAYYRSVLKQRGELVFEEPPTHEFDIGRYNEATMAFPPSVTVKDFTWGGMEGYPNPKPGAGPARFHTVIQIVPVLAAAPAVRR
jgi:hypothetical protein